MFKETAGTSKGSFGALSENIDCPWAPSVKKPRLFGAFLCLKKLIKLSLYLYWLVLRPVSNSNRYQTALYRDRSAQILDLEAFPDYLDSPLCRTPARIHYI